MKLSGKCEFALILACAAMLLLASGLSVAAQQETSVWLAPPAGPSATHTTDYRWCDVADNLYSELYRKTYEYSQDLVQVTFYEAYPFFHGTLTASKLKPNFAYQLKLVGKPDEPACAGANEKIGLAGRWWQEQWDGNAWVGGQNLNYKGDGSSPNTNDGIYFATRDTPSSSPTGKLYRYTGYLVFDYFITDSNGNAQLNFEARSSYHVLFKTSQQTKTPQDGPLKERTFQPTSSDLGYDRDYLQSTTSIFGEWERLPAGGVFLQPGEYTCKVVLTEESFHGSGGEYAGNWAGALEGEISFTIEEIPTLPIPAIPMGPIAAFASMILGLIVTFAFSIRKTRYIPAE